MKKSGRSAERKGASHSQKVAVSSEKKKKNVSYTQGDKVEHIDDVLMSITMKKPKSAFNYFITETMMKEGLTNLTETTRLHSKKWKKMPASEKKKYDDMADEDKERYQRDIELVKKHILQKPSKENATAYRLFLDEHVRKAIEQGDDIKEAKKQAAETWNGMALEDRKEWNEKKKEHVEFYENLNKSRNINSSVNAYALFFRDQAAKAREADSTMSMKECAEKWKKAKPSLKQQYEQYAEDEKEERQKNRDLYEIAYGVKPRRPLGAYTFFLMEAAKDHKLTSIADGPKLWKACTDEEKERYQRIAKKLKLAYLVKKMEYDLSVRKSKSGTRALTPYNLFVRDMKGTVDTKDLPQGGFFNHCYKKWNKLDDAAKNKYIKRAKEEKAETDKSREEIKSRVYEQPKRPRSVYNIYIAETTAALRLKHPKKEQAELFAMAGEMWKSTSEKDKAKFTKIYDKEVEAYDAKMKEFSENTYYTQHEHTEEKKGKRQQQRSESRSVSQSKRAKKTVKE
jgi:hypothetical protein